MRSKGLFLESLWTFWASKASCQSASFEKLIFQHVSNERKTKRIAKFDGLEPWHCENIKGIVAPKTAWKVMGLLRNMPQDRESS